MTTEHVTDIDLGDVAQAIRSAVAGVMPDAYDIVEAVRSGIDAALWTVLPPGSHLRLGDNNEEGTEVVAIRSGRPSSGNGWSESGEVMTHRGAVVRLNDDRRLEVGP